MIGLLLRNYLARRGNEGHGEPAFTRAHVDPNLYNRNQRHTRVFPCVPFTFSPFSFSVRACAPRWVPTRTRRSRPANCHRSRNCPIRLLLRTAHPSATRTIGRGAAKS